MSNPCVVQRLALVAVFVAGCASCGPLRDAVTANPGEATKNVDQIVSATFQAMTAQADDQGTSTALPEPPANETGSISGGLTYPAEGLPSMYVTAFQVGTQNYVFALTAAGRQTYQIEGLAPGIYHVVAYTVGGAGIPAGLAGGYTQAVTCGFRVDCTDHSLIDVQVSAGQTVTGIDPGDWYAPAGVFPPFPQP